MRKTVLIVDDSKKVRAIVKKALSPLACAVLEADNGLDGLGLARRERPDVLLVDFTMPVIGGLELLAKLRSEPALAGTPVVMLLTEGEWGQLLPREQVRARIKKPLTAASIVEAVRPLVAFEGPVEAPMAARSA
jgi:CheY-like chemotaxis protein